MIIKVIDSFDTTNPPPPAISASTLDTLSDDLKGVATSIVSICKLKIQEQGEDMDIATLKEVAKVALDVQKAFYDNKQTNVQVNNIQNNISNTQLNYFKGIMRNEI